jgi:methyl-accepting chemotaxis protein
MNFLSNLTIRNRLMVNAGVIAIALLVMFLMMLSNANTLKSLSSTIAKTASLEAQVLMLRRNEKDFLARKDLKYLGKF